MPVMASGYSPVVGASLDVRNHVCMSNSSYTCDAFRGCKIDALDADRHAIQISAVGTFTAKKWTISADTSRWPLSLASPSFHESFSAHASSYVVVLTAHYDFATMNKSIGWAKAQSLYNRAEGNHELLELASYGAKRKDGQRHIFNSTCSFLAQFRRRSRSLAYTLLRISRCRQCLCNRANPPCVV